MEGNEDFRLLPNPAKRVRNAQKRAQARARRALLIMVLVFFLPFLLVVGFVLFLVYKRGPEAMKMAERAYTKQVDMQSGILKNLTSPEAVAAIAKGMVFL
jgi:cell division septal protein FtsQ